jgi:predicted nucleotidyltransferase
MFYHYNLDFIAHGKGWHVIIAPGIVVKNSLKPYIWIESLEIRQKELEDLRKRTLREVHRAIDTLQKEFLWKELYIIGSVTRPGQFGPKSDIDIAVRGLDKFKYYQFIAKISGHLNRRVDVIRMEECHFSDTIISEGMKWTPKDD